MRGHKEVSVRIVVHENIHFSALVTMVRWGVVDLFYLRQATALLRQWSSRRCSSSTRRIHQKVLGWANVALGQVKVALGPVKVALGLVKLPPNVLGHCAANKRSPVCSTTK